MLLNESWVAGSFFGCKLYCSVEHRVCTLQFTVLVVRLLLTPFLVMRLSDCRTLSDTVGRCRTVSECRTVGLSDAEYDSMTLFDTVHSPSQAESVSDSVGQVSEVSDCRTVGMSECRTSVGLVSECSVGMSDRGSGARSALRCATVWLGCAHAFCRVPSARPTISA